MIRGKKVIAALLAVAMSATMLVGCGGGDKKPASEGGASSEGKKKVSLKVWGPAEEQDLMKELCDAFNKQDDKFEVTFDIKQVSEGDAYTQVSKDAGAAADVFMFAGDQIYALAKGGYLFDMSALESDLGLKVEGVFDPNAIAGATVEGKLFGIPFTPNIPYLFYNKSMLTEEDVKSLDSIIAKDLGAGVKNFAMELNNGFYNNAFFNGVGCTVFGKDGVTPTECNWNDDNGVKVVKYLNSIVATGKMHLSANNDELTLLKDGKLACCITGDWNKATIQKDLGDNYAATVLPSFTIDGTSYNMKTYGSFKQIGVNAKCKEPEAAARFAYFLANKDSQKRRFEVRGYVPTNVELASQSYDDPAVAAVIQQATAEHSVIQPTIDQMQKFWDPAKDLGNKIWKKDKAVADDAAIKKTLTTLVEAVTAQ